MRSVVLTIRGVGEQLARPLVPFSRMKREVVHFVSVNAARAWTLAPTFCTIVGIEQVS